MRDRRLLLLALVGALVLALWWVDGGSTDLRPEADSSGTSQTADQSPDRGTDPDSGLPWVEVDDLPDEAAETIGLIERGGPFPYACCDDTTFRNDEGLLPDHPRGYYREYTVDTPGLDHRGARRIVVGDSGEFYWTDDHYGSFARIRPLPSGGFS